MSVFPIGTITSNKTDGRVATRQMERVFYWVDLTVTQPFNTGIQRVTRCLAKALQLHGIEVIPVKLDNISGKIKLISADEAKHLANWGGPSPVLPIGLPGSLIDEWLIVPEITPNIDVPNIGKSLGMYVAAIFYDMIPLKTPEFYSPEAIDWLTKYWRTFATVDLAIAISHLSEGDLLDWLNVQMLPKPIISICLLPGELPNISRGSSVQDRRAIQDEPLRLLCVGTWEPRKNYPRIIRAIISARKLTAPIFAFQSSDSDREALSKALFMKFWNWQNKQGVTLSLYIITSATTN